MAVFCIGHLSGPSCCTHKLGDILSRPFFHTFCTVMTHLGSQLLLLLFLLLLEGGSLGMDSTYAMTGL